MESVARKLQNFYNQKTLIQNIKESRRKFPRLNAHARYIDEIWCLDLAQMDKLPRWNRGINFLLVTVDVFSRYLRVEPLRRKGAEAVKAAFIKMCSKKNELNFPKKLWLDQGKEFFGDMANFCEDVGIKYYHTYSETKVVFGERAIRYTNPESFNLPLPGRKRHINLYQRTANVCWRPKM